MSWTQKYKLGDKVTYTEPEGYTWDAEITEVADTFVQVCWKRNKDMHPQWEKFQRAYLPNWTRVFDESEITKMDSPWNRQTLRAANDVLSQAWRDGALKDDWYNRWIERAYY